MHFLDTGLPGAWVIEPEHLTDERGFFTRTWCRREFAAHGLDGEFLQGNLSSSRRRGTLRGLHFQLPPSREGKLIRCSQGEIYDVIVDLRCNSTTFLRHFAVILSGANGRSLYVPPGCAHGFETLTDNAEVTYAMNAYYDANLAGGARWNDPAFGIQWPIADPVVMSGRDRSYPDFDPRTFTAFREG